MRGQLLPNANVTGHWVATGKPSHYDGFAVNRETFDEQMRLGMEYWPDPYTGEVFTDANGDPVEFTPSGIGAGAPGDIVLMAYLFAPSEAQMDRFWRLYESTEQLTGRNDALLAIVISGKMILFVSSRFVDLTGVPAASGRFFLESIALFFGIYLVYFIVTYVGFQRNIEEKRR